ncbi:hypothetical protein D3C85_1861140 [compost metagenome]
MHKRILVAVRRSDRVERHGLERAVFIKLLHGLRAHVNVDKIGVLDLQVRVHHVLGIVSPACHACLDRQVLNNT